MEWFLSYGLTAIGGVVVGLVSMFFLLRGKWSDLRLKERKNEVEAEEVENKYKDTEIRRIEKRYEELIVVQEARHLRQLQEQSDLFKERTKSVDDQFKVHSEALRLIHQENLECQRRAAKLQIQNEAQESKIVLLTREVQQLRSEIATLGSGIGCPVLADLKLLDKKAKDTDDSIPNLDSRTTQ